MDYKIRKVEKIEWNRMVEMNGANKWLINSESICLQI